VTAAAIATGSPSWSSTARRAERGTVAGVQDARVTDVRDTTADGDEQDRLLLAAHVAGDPDAFTTLVRRHQDRLWAVALRTLGDREDAADALQEALISAYRAAGGYRGEAKVTTWLHRVVVNACLDRVRRNKVRPTVPMPEDGGPIDPHDRLGDRETAMEIEAALATLPPEQRAALVLVDVQGMPVDDAAAALGVPAGTVKSRCARGRARLAEQLGHLRNRPPAPGVPPTSPSTGGGVA
jgi:RNA polymerase sigma-70 factor (ECF subfamily)